MQLLTNCMVESLAAVAVAMPILKCIQQQPPLLPASALHTSAMKWGFKGILKSCVLKKGPREEPLTATYATQVVTACADVISSPASKHAALA